MYPHRIRLRGPWECRPDAAPPAPPDTVTLPLHGRGNASHFVRRFGYPGRIDTYEHVWLVLTGLAGAQVALNGTTLGAGLAGDCDFEVTALLGARNRLEVALDPAAGALNDVALEVRRDAFLRALTARREADGRVRLTGQVVGTADRPLELYVLAGGTTIHYAPVAAGAPVDVTLSAETPPGPLHVELVGVAEVWYAAEVAVAGA